MGSLRLAGAALAVLCFGLAVPMGGALAEEAELPTYPKAMGLVETLSADTLEGRGAGTEANAVARQLIADRMREIGLIPLGETEYEKPFVYGGFSGNSETGEPARPDKPGINLVGKLEGTGSSDAIMVVTAHFDHLGVQNGEIYNGADDNASGVAGLLLIAEYMAANPPLHDVVFVAFDAEEQGHGGSQAFVRDAPVDMGNVALNLNLDMISRGDNGLLWAAGAYHTPSLRPVIEGVAATAPVTVKLGFDGANPDQDDWTTMSDHRAFHRLGIPFVYLGVEDHPDYHRPGDDFEKIDQAWFAKSLTTVVAMAEALDDTLEMAAVHASTD